MCEHTHVKLISEILLLFISLLYYLNLQCKRLATRCQLSSTVTNLTVTGEAQYVCKSASQQNHKKSKLYKLLVCFCIYISYTDFKAVY